MYFSRYYTLSPVTVEMPLPFLHTLSCYRGCSSSVNAPSLVLLLMYFFRYYTLSPVTVEMPLPFLNTLSCYCGCSSSVNAPSLLLLLMCFSWYYALSCYFGCSSSRTTQSLLSRDRALSAVTVTVEMPLPFLPTLSPVAVGVPLLLMHPLSCYFRCASPGTTHSPVTVDEMPFLLCLSQLKLGTSPRENFFERANPGHPGIFLSNSLPRGQKWWSNSRGWGKIFPNSKKLPFRLAKNPKEIQKITRQYKCFVWRT